MPFSFISRSLKHVVVRVGVLPISHHLICQNSVLTLAADRDSVSLDGKHRNTYAAPTAQSILY